MRVFLERNLFLSGKMATISYDFESQKKDIERADSDSIFLLVYDGMKHSKNILQTIIQAKAKGSDIIVITSKNIFTGSDQCDIIINICTESCTLSKLLLLDMVFQYMAEVYRSIYLPGKPDSK